MGECSIRTVTPFRPSCKDVSLHIFVQFADIWKETSQWDDAKGMVAVDLRGF